MSDGRRAMKHALLWCALLAAGRGFAEAPLSLTASDGSGLKLVALEGRAVVSGPLAFTELLGERARAFATIEKGAAQHYPDGRFLGVDRILREDAGLIGAAWLKVEPGKRAEVFERLSKLGAQLEDQPSLRFVLNWETDANDVDFHIVDGKNGHAWYSHKQLASGGELYADVTTGYVPECFTIPIRPERGLTPTA
jgi:hypothetical protein